MNLHVMTGDFMTGKTTWIVRMLDLTRERDILVAGVVCPAVFENGKKTGIDAMLLPGGERLGYARPRSGSFVDERAHAGVTLPDSPSKMGWDFDPAAMGRINENFASPACADCDLLVIDELGPLELVQGKGYTEALRLLDAGTPRNVLAVIRPALLDMAHERWGFFEKLAPESDTGAFLSGLAA